MDVVRVFNNELSSLYEVKPPISKAKMTQITKCAIKGIKFYKHIVQSVEKFIQKCRPEYKIPGLYVVDSIVRQSRHQFGADKDVFAPRFCKNIMTTFLNLFKCADEDKPKIVRVLNLWQKNHVFPSEVIVSLLDIAHRNSAGEWIIDPNIIEQHGGRKDAPQAPAAEPQVQNSKSKAAEVSSWKGWPQNTDEPAEEGPGYTEMTAKNLEKFAKANYASSAVPEPVQVPQAKTVPHKSTELVQEENTIKFNKKLLDFDYGDEEDEDEIKTDDAQMPSAPNPLALSMAQNLLSNPDLLRQLQQMQQTIQSEAMKSELGMQPQAPPQEPKQHYSPEPPDNDSMQEVNTVPYHEPHPPNIMPYPPYDNTAPYPAPQQPQMPLGEPKMPMDIGYQHPMMPPPDDMLIQPSHDEDERMIYSMPGEPPLPPQDLDERAVVMPPVEERVRKERSRSRSGSRSRGRLGRHRSRSRSPRRRKSRSRSRSRSQRNRSLSRERERQRERKRRREKEQERRKKGIPPIKKNHISVCSTTLWLGHVPKILSEIDISSVFKDFGQILSIDMIPPRGCAYVVMHQRQDAHRALQKLKNLKLQGSLIKMAWAPGKGVKGKEFKDYWEVDSGVSYIPFDKVPSNDLQVLDLLEEGGFIDEESLPQSLKDLRKQADNDPVPMNDKEHVDDLQEVMMPQAPSGPSMMPNTSMGLPMVIPPIMQPQFGMPLPGLLPPQSMVVQMPVAVPPPSQLMMVQPPAQTLLAGTPLPVGSIPQMPHMSLPHPSLPPSSVSMNMISNMDLEKDHSMPATSTTGAGDATPTDEDGTSVSSPGCTSVGQSLPSAVSSLSSAGTQASTGQFNPVMAHHGMSRPMLPPVSSAGTPIPFPPPQVGFGFPPPPLRPGVPNQNLTGVIPMPNSFPWLHKTTAPAFGNFSDAEMRFTSPPVNMRPPMMNQPNAHPNTSVCSDNQIASKDGMKSAPLQKDKNAPPNDGKQFSNRSNSNQPHGEPYGRPISNSPNSYDKDHDSGLNNQDDRHPPDFPREMDMGMMPRFPGPPDFHAARGALRGHWMPGPGQRFPRNMHPGMPFPPRMPRMEMDFFHHQGPPGPRMHVPGPRGQQPFWGGNGFPPRNQDRSNRRDYYGEPHYQDEDREKKFHPREERNRGRDHREESERRSSDDKRSMKPVEFSKSVDIGPKGDGRSTPSVKNDASAKPPKPMSDDLSLDLFRLQNYNNRNRRQNFGTNFVKNKKSEQKTSKPPSQSETVAENKAPKEEKADPVKADETKPTAAETEKSEERIEQPESENRSRRDRADRKRSRWGRTLSQEREFQQQRINEIEMKFQNFESQHQALANVNGCFPSDQQSDVSSLAADTSAIPADSNVGEVDTSDDRAETQPDCDSNQNVVLDTIDNHSTDEVREEGINSASDPAPDLHDSATAQVTLTC